MKKQTFYYSIEAECEDNDYLTFAELKRPVGYKSVILNELNDDEKFAIALIFRAKFDNAKGINECRTIIEILDKLEIPTKEFKNDFEFEFKQPYKN